VEPANPRGEIPVTGLRLGDVVSLHVALKRKDGAVAILPPEGSGHDHLLRGRRAQAVVTVNEARIVHVFQVARLPRIRGRLLHGTTSAPSAEYAIQCR